MNTQTYIGTLTIIECYKCGVMFGVPREFNEKRLHNHNLTFYCPAGHGQVYAGETQEDKLRRRIESLHSTLTNKNEEIQRLNYSNRAIRAAKTKIMNRVKNGVCPCCNRTFANLQNHFKSKHPELIAHV